MVMTMNSSKSSFNKLISLRISLLCMERNISTNKLAAMSGLRQSTVQNIVSGNTKNPTLKTLDKIAKGLDMTIAELLDFPELNELQK